MTPEERDKSKTLATSDEVEKFLSYLKEDHASKTEFATKAELAEVRKEIRAELVEVRKEIHAELVEVRKEIRAVDARKELRAADFRYEIRNEIRNAAKAELAAVRWILTFQGALVLAIAAKLFGIV